MPTGEEDEATEFQHDGVLYGFDPAGWKERGRGELRVNIAPSGAQLLGDVKCLAIGCHPVSLSSFYAGGA